LLNNECSVSIYHHLDPSSYAAGQMSSNEVFLSHRFMNSCPHRLLNFKTSTSNSLTPPRNNTTYTTMHPLPRIHPTRRRRLPIHHPRPSPPRSSPPSHPRPRQIPTLLLLRPRLRRPHQRPRQHRHHLNLLRNPRVRRHPTPTNLAPPA
jgi:hypothetical protein